MEVHPTLKRCFWPSLLVIFVTSLTACGLSQGTAEYEHRPSSTDTPESERRRSHAVQLAQVGTGTVDAVAWSPDGDIMATGGSTGIRLYDAETLRETKHIDTQSWVRSLAFSPDGRMLAAGPGANTYTAQPPGSRVTLWDADTGHHLRTLDVGTTGFVVGFGPDGRTLATQGFETMQLWDIETGTLLHGLTGQEIIVSSNLHVAITQPLSSSPTLTLWDLSSGERLHTLEETWIRRVTLSPDGHTLAMSTEWKVGESDRIKVFDVESGQLLRTLEGPWYSHFLAFSPDGHTLAAGDSVIQVWDTATGRPLCTLTEQEYSYGLAFSPDGHTLVVGSDDRTLRLWDTTTCRETRTFETFKGFGWIRSVAFSPDGRILTSKELDTIRLWDVHSNQLLRTFDRSPVEKVVLTPDERLFVVRAKSTTVWRWDVVSRQLVLLNTLPGSSDAPYYGPVLLHPSPTALSPDGQMLATVADDHAIKLWNTRSGENVHTLRGHTLEVTGLAFSPDGTILASTGVLTFTGSGPAANSDVRLWDTKTGALLSTHETYPRGTRVKAFTSNRRLLATWYVPDSCGRGGGSASVETLDVNDLLTHRSDVRPVWSGDSWPGPAGIIALSPEKRIVAAVFQDAACISRPAFIKVWDTKTGNQLATLSYDDPNMGSSVIFYTTATTFSPDETVIAVGLRNGTVDLWHISSGNRLNTFEGLTTPATSLVYSPDGQRLASGNQDGSIQLWDAATGVLLHTSKGHTAAVTHLAFNADGTILASGSQDGTARLWSVDSTIPPTPDAAPTTAILATQNAQLSTQVAALETREALPTFAPTPTPTSTPPPSSVLHWPISLGPPQANAALDFLDPPVGDVMLGDVPFQLPGMVFKSQASTPPYDDYPTRLLLEEEVPRAHKAYLLLNAGNGFTEFEGKVVGQVVAYCDDVPTVIADLRLGREVREWHAGDNVVSTATHTRQVWSSPIAGAPGETGYIDMLSLDLPTACRSGRLTAIEIIDTSVETTGSLDPALNLFGITVEGYR